MIQGMLNSGAIPALQRLVQFTGARHKVLTNNIANLSTPYFKPADLDTKAFQATLADAIDRRRSTAQPLTGELQMRNTTQIEFRPDGIDVQPSATNDNILFHDQNNRDLERTMQRLAENTLTHNAAIELLRSEFDMMRTAIRERF